MATCSTPTIYNYTFSIASSLQENEWLLTKSFYGSQIFLKSTAIANNHLEHRFVIVKNNEEVLAQFYFQLLPFRGGELKSYLPVQNSNFVKRMVQSFVDCALDKVDWSLAVMGNIFITGENGQHWIKENISAEEKWNIIAATTQELADKEEIDAFLITDLYEEDLQSIEILQDKKFRPFDSEPDMILKLDDSWESFEDYLQAFSSKYRVRCKKVFKVSKAVEVRSLSLEELDSLESEMYSLHQNVLNKVAFKLAMVTPKYHSAIKKSFPEKYEVLGYFVEEKLIGFISFYHNDDNLDIHLVGLDYEVNNKYKLYQRILYDCVRNGIENHHQIIHFGRTASAIKTTVGAIPINSRSYIKHNQRISNIAIKPLTTYLKPEPFEVRHPFK